MKKIYLALTLCCALIACKKNDVNFTYSPETPKAGEKVTFTNHTTMGQDWEWDFGDNGTSTLKSPSHTYKIPGTYRVILKVDKRAAWTATKQIEVQDTIPSISCEDTVFYIYKDYTFKANVYNPYNNDIKYKWIFPLNTIYCLPTDTTETYDGSSISVYFTQALDEAPIGLRLIIERDTLPIIEKKFLVQDRQTNSVLLRSANGDFRQRIFNSRAEDPRLDESAKDLLDIEQDTFQTYNGHDFTLSEIKEIFPEVEGFHIASRKIYIRAEGLWVANITGANLVQIDETPCVAMTLDTKDSRIYWANEKGVWYMPFIGSDNNQFISTPALLNPMTNVTKIATDSEPK